MKINRPWSDEEIDMLIQMGKAGKTLDEVCKVFPYRSRESIRTASYRYGYILSTCSRAEINYDAFKELMKGGKHGSVRM